MKTRTEIYAADLYVLLQRELRRRQPSGCDSCFVQVPFRVDRRDENSPNWEVLLPPSCERGCNVLIEDLVADLGKVYELRPEDDRSRCG